MNENKGRKSFDKFFNEKEFQLLIENYSQFITKFRRYYTSGQRYTFREWLNIVGELLDTLV